MFYMNMRAFNEGEQAEAYKKRKVEERIKDYENNRPRSMHQMYSSDGKSKIYYAASDRGISDYDSDKGRVITKAEKNGLDEKRALKHVEKMKDNARKASEITRKEMKNRNNDERFDKYYQVAMDATAKHLRRHPESYKEDCGIFESVEII